MENGDDSGIYHKVYTIRSHVKYMKNNNGMKAGVILSLFYPPFVNLAIWWESLSYQLLYCISKSSRAEDGHCFLVRLLSST